MAIDYLKLLEWAGLAAAVLWTIGLWGLVMGSRKAKRAFRGKGYLRPPTGKAWLRFLYYKHYDSFEDPGIRFFYGLSHLCLAVFVFLAFALLLFLGLILLLGHVSWNPTTSPS